MDIELLFIIFESTCLGINLDQTFIAPWVRFMNLPETCIAVKTVHNVRPLIMGSF